MDQLGEITRIMEYPSRIYLTGFMGCGKSHSGQLLARQIGYAFADLDDIFEQSVGGSIAAYFSRHGEAAFRQEEAKILRGTAVLARHVIACGGGTPCFHGNMEWINAHGLSIYLKASPHLLAARLRPERAHRPLLRDIQDAELENFIREKLAIRESFYEKAALWFDQDQSGFADLKEALEYFLTSTGSHG
jgi:shikimate kinase